jgi:hypothetical protein
MKHPVVEMLAACGVSQNLRMSFAEILTHGD